MVSLLDFINSVSETDNIQDVFAVFLQFDSSVFLFLFSLLAYYISVNKDLLLLQWSVALQL